MKFLENKNLVKLFKVFLVVTLVQVLISLVITLAAFPTEEHRSINRDLTDMITSPEMADKLLHVAPEAADYIETVEYKYSNQVVGIGNFVSFTAVVAMTYFGYRYIRRRNLSKDAVSATVTVFVAAAVISALLSMLIEAAYGSMALVSLPLLIGGLGFGAIGALVRSYIIAIIARYFYDKKYGFEVN